jgi:SUMO ligase MMS21 Smc5/6 complex component
LFFSNLFRFGIVIVCVKITAYKNTGWVTSVDRRIGISAIPSDPKSYLNEQQQLGLMHLREYGWTTFFVRHPSETSATTILRNKHNKMLGILNEDGTLRLAQNLKVRDNRSEETADVEEMVDSIKQQVKKSPSK